MHDKHFTEAASKYYYSLLSFFFFKFKSHLAISEIDAICKNLLRPQNLVHTM